LIKKVSIVAIYSIIQFVSSNWDAIFIENKKIPPFQHQIKKSSFMFLNNFLYAESPEKSKTDPGSEAYINYINLKKLYLKWNTGALKSENRSKKFINAYLQKIIDREILTDYDYVVISPEGRYGKELKCSFLLDKWLLIKGDISQEILSKIVEKNPGILTNWWRSTKLLSVQGKVIDFKIEPSDQLGEIIILYLSDIKLKESDANNTGKNSK
jgi:hypothetical protein